MQTLEVDPRKSSPVEEKITTRDDVIRSQAYKHETSKHIPTTFPQREMLLIWIIHASQGFQTTMLFPLLVFMVERFGKGGGKQQSVGQYAGILASLYPLAQFCTSWMWGAISDKTGRKSWLAFGNIVSAISAFLLGLCKDYTSACTVRFIGGLLNGTLTITKSMLGELCDESNQAKGFGILNLAWGFGSVAGPVISGLLAQPCLQYAINGCPSFFQLYPFFLPCFIASIFSIAAIFASRLLKETNTRNHAYRQVPCQIHVELEDFIPKKPKNIGNLLQDKSVQVENDQPTYKGSLTGTETQSSLELFEQSNGGDLEQLKENENSFSIEVENIEGEEAGRRYSTLLDRDVLLASFCYSMTGMIFIITDELFPLFGAASKDVGGLGFTSYALGLILGEGGVVLFIYTLLLYPTIARRFGPLNCFRYGVMLSIPLWMLFPVSSMLSSIPLLQWLILLASMAARSMVAATSFTGVLILVSNSASPRRMGAVTGLSHSFCSFFRAVGPALGGMIWSYASKCSFPLHQFLAWFFVAALSFCTFWLSFLLPHSLNHPKSTSIESNTQNPTMI